MDLADRADGPRPAALTGPWYGDPQAWADGPDRVYGRLAAAAARLLDRLGADPPPRVLDAGTGTGTVARMLRDAGAEVVAVDISHPMLVHARTGRAPGVVGDLCALPLRGACFDAAVAAFVLSHVPDPVRSLAELARVVRPGGTVLATAFPAGDGTPSHPAKIALDRVLADFDYRPPRWYAELKARGEVQVGEESRLLDRASDAGLAGPRVDRVDVRLAGLDADALMRWRFGMAQVAPWLAGQDECRRAEIRQAGLAALARVPAAPLPMLVLRGTAADRRR